MTFNQDVSACVYIATTNVGATVGLATASRDAAGPTVVEVRTYGNTGSAADRAFNLAVPC